MEDNIKKGVLYIVATPIGNLEDITLRAIRVLKEVNLIAAEDTRRTRKLIDAYQIRTPMTSLHDHIEGAKSGMLISKISEGADVALVSDAGTPGISDPGYILINRAIAEGIEVIPVPGPSAVITALSVSGLPMDSFVFYGFLPAREAKRRGFLSTLLGETKTMVFYESPKRLYEALCDIEEILGDRDIVVLREMTKAFEEVVRGRTADVARRLEGRVVRGEVTLVIGGRGKKTVSVSDDEIIEKFDRFPKDSGSSRRDLIDKIAKELGVPRKKVYKLVVNRP
ncbi:MAG TPA: 16S rRNA (cytidine(1402)-2'-O)-methyltransferase [Syntrophales bacterium]|nr:16S rRNA (cytidine(1402)-2'-O)-methyltransferase [Syntrophales bacterium]